MIDPNDWAKLFSHAKDANLSLTAPDGSKLSVKSTASPVPKMQEAPPKPVESPVSTPRVMEDMNPQDPRYGMMMQSMVPPIESRPIPMDYDRVMMSGRNDAGGRTRRGTDTQDGVPPMSTSPAEQRNESFNQKATQANLEAAEATLAELEARKAAGQPVNEHTLENTRKAVAYQRSMMDTGQSTAPILEGVTTGATLGDPGSSASRSSADTTLQGADDSISVDGRKSVTVGGKTYFVDAEKGTLVDRDGNPINFDQNIVQEAGAFGLEQLGFKKQDLGRFLLYAAGGMLFGGSRDGSLNWAARKVLQESDQRRETEKQETNQMREWLIANKDKYSRADMEKILQTTKESGISAGWDAIINTPVQATPEEIAKRQAANEKALGELTNDLQSQFTELTKTAIDPRTGKRVDQAITYGDGYVLDSHAWAAQYAEFLEKFSGPGGISKELANAQIHRSIAPAVLKRIRETENFNGNAIPFFQEEFIITQAGSLGAGATTQDYTEIANIAESYGSTFNAEPLKVIKDSNRLFGELSDSNRANFGDRGQVAFVKATLSVTPKKRQELQKYLKQNKDKTITIAEVNNFLGLTR